MIHKKGNVDKHQGTGLPTWLGFWISSHVGSMVGRTLTLCLQRLLGEEKSFYFYNCLAGISLCLQHDVSIQFA